MRGRLVNGKRSGRRRQCRRRHRIGIELKGKREVARLINDDVGKRRNARHGVHRPRAGLRTKSGRNGKRDRQRRVGASTDCVWELVLECDGETRVDNLARNTASSDNVPFKRKCSRTHIKIRTLDSQGRNRRRRRNAEIVPGDKAGEANANVVKRVGNARVARPRQRSLDGSGTVRERQRNGRVVVRTSQDIVAVQVLDVDNRLRTNLLIRERTANRLRLKRKLRATGENSKRARDAGDCRRNNVALEPERRAWNKRKRRDATCVVERDAGKRREYTGRCRPRQRRSRQLGRARRHAQRDGERRMRALVHKGVVDVLEPDRGHRGKNISRHVGAAVDRILHKDDVRG